MRKRKLLPPNNYVFLNIPYDPKFHRLYIAYIAGLTHLGLVPRATFEIVGGRNRSDRIIDLIRSCQYSIHDLSRVQLNRKPPTTPRFNMPFELGLTVAVSILDPNFDEKENPHTWFIFETLHGRVAKSLSDLGGADANIHTGTVEGVMRELNNSFIRAGEDQPSVSEMMRTYRTISKLVEAIQKKTRARSLYEPAIFRQLYYAAAEAAHLQQA